jgi:hypothetical protein
LSDVPFPIYLPYFTPHEGGFLDIYRAAARRRGGAPRETVMLLIRDIMYCKPGKVRPMVDKFRALAKVAEKKGMGKMRVLTDVSAERYWTVVSEMEVPSLEAFMAMAPGGEGGKEIEEIMKGYHDLVDHGRREVYTIES